MSKSNRLITQLDHHFLVSMPSVDDGTFDHSVIYVCNHDDEGTMGLMINQPMEDVSFVEIAEGMGIESEIIRHEPIIFNGGPVENNRGFVVHSPDYQHESTLELDGRVSLSATADIVDAIAQGLGPKEFNFCLGYAGWRPGQLEDEIAQNSWLVIPADPDILFNMPVEQRYEACLKRAGASSIHFVEAAGVA